MATYADAQPEKRLFISLLTRDISLADAILDLIDNSINSALVVSRRQLNEPSDYLALLNAEKVDDLPLIQISISGDEVCIADTCGGISLKDAAVRVFKFGRQSQPLSSTSDPGLIKDTLSVYGIGLKRAIFKIGSDISIESRHPEGGFKMKLDVAAWAKKREKQWQIPISPLNGLSDQGTYGTIIRVTSLYPDIRRRIADGTFTADP